MESETGVVDRTFFPDAREDVLQLAPDGVMVVNVVGGHKRNAQVVGQLGQSVQLFSIIALVVSRYGQMALVPEIVPVLLQSALKARLEVEEIV
jgi:hypothetical protein